MEERRGERGEGGKTRRKEGGKWFDVWKGRTDGMMVDESMINIWRRRMEIEGWMTR